jgi:hypothetical protein
VATDPGQSGIIITPSYVPTKRPSRRERKAARGFQEIEIWLDGEVVACGCPDCGAPMSIRMWLKLADCFRCSTGIELSEEIIEEIERLEQQAKQASQTAASPVLGRTAAAAAGHATATQATSAPAVDVPVPPPPPLPDARRKPAEPHDHDRRVAAAAQPGRVRKKIHSMAAVGTARVFWREVLHDLPAWLISGVLHLAALLLLAMMVIASQQPDEPYITLSTKVDRIEREGGETVSLPSDEVEFDLPVDPNDLPDSHDAKVKLDQDARDLRLDKETVLPNVQSYEDVVAAVKSNDPARRALAVRDPRVRAEVVREEGGTVLTEAAVARGLRWMAQHQNADGSWSLHAFDTAAGCRCSGRGNIRSDTAGTALALLPFLGAGQTHLVGKYQNQVAAGLRYLISIQKEDGDLRGNSTSNSGMYAHGQAALVLSEAYKMTGDETFRVPAQKAIDFIAKAQYTAGGWRYAPYFENPNDTPDTSVLGWQILALHSAKQAYLDVPDSALGLANNYLDKARATVTKNEQGRQVEYGQRGGLYGYLPRNGFKHSMTAEALLCRMMLGWKLENPGLQEGIGYLLDYHLPTAQDKNLYYWYYGTQMMHHVGGESWDKWNARIRDLLVRLQETSGHEIGSWPPNICQHGGAGGRLYTTAFSTAILEVYYRHAPLFRQIELE